MGLFSPWFLAGVVAVGLPIWLHLLKRASTDPKPFPSLMFFEHREATTVHKKLDFILLFILRTLMLILLALLFANPFIRTSTPAGRGERIVVVAVDRSFSMRTREGAAAGTRLDQAKNEALSVIGQIPGNTKAQVVALAGTLQAMTQQVTDLGQLRVAVAAIQPSDSRASYGELARYLRTLRESADVPIEVHLISDMQKSAMPPGFTDLRLDSGTTLKLHPIGSVQPNWAVETVNAPARLYDPAQAKIAVTIAGFNAPKATRTVTLLLNGKTVNSKSVEVAENGRGTVEFTGLEASQGFNKCEVRIDSSDNLPADDRYSFAVERADPKKVLFIDDGRRPNAEKFFRAALESAKDGEYSMELQRGVAGNSDFSKYAVVVLSDLTSVPDALEKSLSNFVNKGGGVFEALGAGSAQMRTAPLLGEAIQGTGYAGREGERFWSVADIDTGHPALANVERMDGVKFFQIVKITANKSQVLARLSEGSPLILQQHIGEGNVLAFTSSLDQASNDLPLKPSYVPFIQQAIRYLGGGGAAQPVNLSVDSYVELRTGDGEKGVMAEILDPSGQRALSLEEAASAPNYALRAEGFYDVKTAAGRRTLVAAHADRRESDLTPMDQETRDLWSATGEAVQPTGDVAQAGAVNGSTTPHSLSLYILVLLLGVALAESVIANRYLRSPAQYEG